MGTIIGLVFDTPDEEYICPHCSKQYKSRENLDKHVKEKHPEAAEGPTDEAQD